MLESWHTGKMLEFWYVCPILHVTLTNILDSAWMEQIYCNRPYCWMFFVTGYFNILQPFILVQLSLDIVGLLSANTGKNPPLAWLEPGTPLFRQNTLYFHCTLYFMPTAAWQQVWYHYNCYVTLSLVQAYAAWSQGTDCMHTSTHAWTKESM